MTSCRRFAANVAVLSVLFVCVGSVEAADLRVTIADGMTATLGSDHRIVLEVLPRPNEGLIRFAARLGSDPASQRRISEANGGVERLEKGVRYRVPFEVLNDDLQLQVVRGLFGDDRVGSDGWRHQVAERGDFVPSLWTIAEWFTGDGENFRRLRESSGLADEELQSGQEVRVPRELLRASLRQGLPERVLGPSPFVEYGRDAEGEFAVYRLQRGEALYSSVVVRFTSRLYADDVNELASEVARRSGITDVRDIPVGYPVKIPLGELAPEFLPPDHPGRIEYEDGLTQSARHSNKARSRDLEGVTVIIDAGHGGRDVGASIGGVWESVYVYDIMLRVQRLLEQSTAANVVVTTRDGGNMKIGDRDVLGTSRGHQVLTSPPYRIEDSRVSSNLRWYLANSVLSKNGKGRSAEKVVFISIHADSLHPSLRGAMVYVPGLLRNPPNYGKTGTVYTSRREVRERPRVDFSRSERVRSEGLSRDLAGHIVDSFRRNGLAVHPNKPIRDRVIRNKRAWVPAVLRFNAVPAKVLVEVCNLANAEDRRLVQTRAFREKVANTIVGGLTAYYGLHPDERPQVASR
jgi:N-acetylmuramoyl-L-alanine amidase